MDLHRRNATEADAAGANPFKLYHYDPTIAGAVIFVLLFLATTILHFWQLVKSKCWFLLPLAIGGILEVIGYAARAKSGGESPDWTLGPYIIQAILLLVAPALYAATIYMELGRIITVIDGEGHVIIRKEWMTKLFVTGDVLSFFLQGGGGGYQAAGSLEALNTGAKIIIVGLFVQLICFGFFVVTAVSFHRSINKAPTGRSNSSIPWRRHMNALYLGSFLIMVRSLFRAVEYLQGFDGYLLRHEAYLYIFDAVFMLLTMILFNYIHPAEIAAILAGGGGNEGWKMGALPHHHLQRL
ncbi:RTA1 domain protein [Colletotrichum truncatum]|uniref:RTA1 domain protein n=1 Tax=Colletotrichum truncatum TaxID=5467 RepID=A0ACC3YR09_COLTU|nr:RTA1 domain protein [Colletotrichum truncatum]KAF6799078.1 RTA1 domain protein [Colletotrichum truncatum]